MGSIVVDAQECSGLPLCEEALELLAGEVGGNLREDRTYQIHRDTLKWLFGSRYIEALDGMEHRGFIEQRLDKMNPLVHEIQFLQSGLDSLSERKEQRQQQLRAKEKAGLEQARQDAIALLRRFKVTQAGKVDTVTAEGLAKLLGSSIQTRLDYLVKGNYLVTSGFPDCPGQYKLTFLPKSLELLPVEGQDGPRKRLDPRNRKGALIRYGNIHGLAIDARCWLRNLADPQKSKANASETMLQDLIAHRYKDLQKEYPDLLLEIKAALVGSQSVRGTPTGAFQATECV